MESCSKCRSEKRNLLYFILFFAHTHTHTRTHTHTHTHKHTYTRIYFCDPEIFETHTYK